MLRFADEPLEITVTTDKPLYTWQIDIAGESILNKNDTAHAGMSLADSLGNVAVLESWLAKLHF